MIDNIKILGCSLVKTFNDIINNDNCISSIFTLCIGLMFFIPFMFIPFVCFIAYIMIKERNFKNNWNIYMTLFITFICMFIVSIMWLCGFPLIGGFITVELFAGPTIPYMVINMFLFIFGIILYFVLTGTKFIIDSIGKNYVECKKEYDYKKEEK